MSISGIDALGYLSAASAATAASESSQSFASVLNSSKSEPDTGYDSAFEAASEVYNVPVSLLKAVAKTESNFNANATSYCGAMGVMQLMPGTAAALGVNDAYDAGQNIMGGAKYLRQLLDEFNGDTQLAVAAYNAGPGNVEKYGGVPPFSETQNYVVKVMGYYNEYSGSESTDAKTDTMSQLQELLSAATGVNGADSVSSMMLMSALQMQMQDDSDDEKQVIF